MSQTTAEDSQAITAAENGQSSEDAGRAAGMARFGKAFVAVSKMIASKKNRLAEVVNVQNDFLKKFGVGANAVPYADAGPTLTGWRGKVLKYAVDPSGNFYYIWLGVVTVAVMYNAITVTMRSVFHEFQTGYLAMWLVFDYIFDLIYLTDMLVKLRTVKNINVLKDRNRQKPIKCICCYECTLGGPAQRKLFRF